MKPRTNHFKASVYCLLALSSILFSLKAFGAIINIPTSAYPTIQAGIDAANSGDTVLVANGTYTGMDNKNLDFMGKAIIVKSAGGPENCIIDCENAGRGFDLRFNEPKETVIDGFTIINGRADRNGYGGAIRCQPASPTIKNCIFKNNYGGQWGGALRFGYGSDATVINCIIADNLASYGGGAVSIYWSSLEFINCTFYHNESIVGIIGISGLATFTNCIFWDNIPIQISNTAVIAYSNVQGGHAGTGNIDDNPLFVDPANGDFHLQSSSPSKNTGTDAGVYFDIEGDYRPLGSGFDMGADELQIDDFVIQNQALSRTRAFGACETITAGPAVNITATGDVNLQAGEKVILTSGFSVEDAGRLSVVVDPSTCP